MLPHDKTHPSTHQHGNASATAARALTPLLAVACGAIGLNLVAAQPLVGAIARSLGLEISASGLVSMATLLGYAGGMMFIVPLTDLLENRRLILHMLILDVIALAACALAPNAVVYLLAAFVVGVGTSTIQMLVPLVASLAPEAERGRVVGNVMSGVMVGVLLSRPLAMITAQAFGWRGVFAGSALVILTLAVILYRKLPSFYPTSKLRYVALLRSLIPLVRKEATLQRHALSAILAFGSFNVFWTIVAMRLAQPPFGLGPMGIAAFALTGVGGSLVAPLAGRLGDRGLTRPVNVVLHLAIILALVLAWAAGGANLPDTPLTGIALLVLSSLLLDVGVIGDQTLGRRAVNMICPKARGRLNGLFTGAFFVGGAVASGLAGLTWAHGGWGVTCALGMTLGVAALSVSLSAYVGVANPGNEGTER